MSRYARREARRWSESQRADLSSKRQEREPTIAPHALAIYNVDRFRVARRVYLSGRAGVQKPLPIKHMTDPSWVEPS